MHSQVHSQPLDDLWLTVCWNETVASYRDLENALIPVARALLDGWMPDLLPVRGIARQRAGYLVDLLVGWMPETQARLWLKKRDQLAGEPERFVSGPFFHGDPVAGPCQDELARHWGLTRGLNIARLRQALKSPYLC
jgi:hypothetical protein